MKSINTKKSIIALIIFCPLLAAAQSLNQVRQRAEFYVTMFGGGSQLNGSVRSIPGNPGGWTYSTRNYSIALDRDLLMKRLSNDPARQAIYANKNFDPNLPYVGDTALIHKAKLLSSALTQNPDLKDITIHLKQPLNAAGKPTMRGIAQVRIETKKDIYARGYGNSVWIDFDYQTGEILAVDNRSGYSYEPLDNLIPAEDAIQTAKAAVGTTSDPQRHLLMYIEGPRRPDGSDPKHCIPVHSIWFEGGINIYVDAKTGAFISRLQARQAPPRPGGSIPASNTKNSSDSAPHAKAVQVQDSKEGGDYFYVPTAEVKEGSQSAGSQNQIVRYAIYGFIGLVLIGAVWAWRKLKH